MHAFFREHAPKNLTRWADYFNASYKTEVGDDNLPITEFGIFMAKGKQPVFYFYMRTPHGPKMCMLEDGVETAMQAGLFHPEQVFYLTEEPEVFTSDVDRALWEASDPDRRMN